MICTDSIHSKHKVATKYPQVNQSMIEQLYGLHVASIKQLMWDFKSTLPQVFNLTLMTMDKEYAELNKLNLTEFFYSTTSKYFLFHCHMQSVNCRPHWKVRRTSLGTCLTLSPNDVYKAAVNEDKERLKRRLFRKLDRTPNPGVTYNDSVLDILASLDEVPPAADFRELDFIIGYNKSDLTFGWNGLSNVMMLYYMDSDEKFISKSHKISLVPGLNPTVTFSRSETKLLGKPFTSCSHDKNYSQRTCEVHKYMNHVIKKCNCYPRLLYHFRVFH